MRKTKIVCTIGPSCNNEETITKMCLAGMNVARLNFSHGTHEDHKKSIDIIKTVREKLGLPIAILLDTKGPEYRIKTFREGKIMLSQGDKFIFTSDDVEGDATRVSVNYKNLPAELDVGDKILLNNGLVMFEVEKIENTEIHCSVIIGGELSDRKSMSFPNKVLKQKYLSDHDKSDLLFGIENGVDFIACSFVSVKQDLLDVKHFLRENGGGDLDVIAKIENRSGVDNIREICEETGILVKVKDHLITVNEYYDDWKFISHYYICEAVGKSERKLTNAEIKTGLVPEWVNIEFIRDLWSRHDEFKREETRGSYLREHTALCEYFEVTK